MSISAGNLSCGHHAKEGSDNWFYLKMENVYAIYSPKMSLAQDNGKHMTNHWISWWRRTHTAELISRFPKSRGGPPVIIHFSRTFYKGSSYWGTTISGSTPRNHRKYPLEMTNSLLLEITILNGKAHYFYCHVQWLC